MITRLLTPHGFASFVTKHHITKGLETFLGPILFLQVLLKALAKNQRVLRKVQKEEESQICLKLNLNQQEQLQK